MTSGNTTQQANHVLAAPLVPLASGLGCAGWRDGVVRRGHRIALVLCLAAATALAIDIPVSRFAQSLAHVPVLTRVWAAGEVFGDGVGVLAIVSVLALLYRTARPAVPRLLLGALGGGLMADAIKLLVVRSRPRAFDCAQGVFGSFHGLGPWAGDGDGLAIWDRGLHSFPSAHSATAAGLAMGLAWIFPRARWLVSCLTVLVMWQRIVSGAHFPSDTLVGVAVGCVVAAYCLDRRGLGMRLDALELWLSTRRRNPCGSPHKMPSCERAAPADTAPWCARTAAVDSVPSCERTTLPDCARHAASDCRRLRRSA